MGEQSSSSRELGVEEEFLTKYLEKGAEADFKPYIQIISEGFSRCFKLIELAAPESDASGEILRATVVLNHAYLEDFMRTLVLAFLPTADEKALDGIPLAALGQNERAEKFSLGKLVRHRGKTVNTVIFESVSAHLEKSTFNSVKEIMGFLERIGMTLPKGESQVQDSLPELAVTPEVLAMLDEMIRRRHHIVHRADKNQAGTGLQPINAVQVLGWLAATMTFTLSAAQTAFLKKHSFAEFKKKVDAMQEAFQAVRRST